MQCVGGGTTHETTDQVEISRILGKEKYLEKFIKKPELSKTF